VLKGKLFFFGGEEWKYIRRYTDPVRRTLPTRAERRGDLRGRDRNAELPGNHHYRFPTGMSRRS